MSQPAIAANQERAQLLRLCPSSSPWQVVPKGLALLARDPEDAELALAVAGKLVDLGLGTPAGELLENLTGDDAEALRAQAAALPPDVIDPERVLARCRANVEALAPRGVELSTHLRGVKEWLHEVQVLRILDGNLAVRAGTGARSRWTLLGDALGQARAFADQHVRELMTAEGGPITLDGVFPPFMLVELDRLTPPERTGYQRELRVLCESEPELVKALCLADLRSILSSPRVSVYAGADAAARLEEELMGRLDEKLVGAVIAQPGQAPRVGPGAREVLTRIEAAFTRERDELDRRVSCIYAGRDGAWYARRFRAWSEGGDPLRVLIPTCLHSTYIRHASHDLAEALKDRGCSTRLLMERSNHANLSSIAYLRELAEFTPDVVVLINYPRAAMPKVFPDNLPFVCWVQDAMPHLFRPDLLARTTAFDFIMGHVYREVSSSGAYDATRLARAPVVASARKFHTGPITYDQKVRTECDIAFVTHHSETPEQMHERMMREARGQGSAGALLERLRPLVHAAGGAEHPSWPMVALRHACAQVVEREPESCRSALADQLFRQYACPLGDRVFRHRVMGWAARLAERRRWRVRVFGRGWQDHPEFANFAAGELSHDDELRAAYQCAGVTIHASLTAAVHQRIMECALSGGMPLVALHMDHLGASNARVGRALVRSGEPDHVESDGRAAYGLLSTPESAMRARTRQLLGIEQDAFSYVGPKRFAALASGARVETGDAPEDLLVDPSETCFMNAEQLEQRLEALLDSPSRRAALSGAIASRVRARYSHDALAGRMFEMLARSLGSTDTSARSAAA